MAVAGLYRRVLPSPPAFEFASPEGKKLFTEALGDGTMEGFFKLISYYETQSEPAYCGLASLSMVLNALSIDPGRKWKGPWRWFDDSMLDCCEPLEKVRSEGITFGKVACLAHCNGANVETFRANESTVDEFRKFVISCSSSEDCHVITSYHRGSFKQTGTGHFSPIGGYHVGRDMVLILDVARFKYPPHWVPLTLLWEGMNTVDLATGLPRGYMIVSRLNRAPSILYTVSCGHESWKSVAKYLIIDVPLLLKSGDVKDVQELLSVVFKSPPADLREFIKWIAEVRRQEDGTPVLSEEEKGRLAVKEEVLKLVRETELFRHVSRWMKSQTSLCKSTNRCDEKKIINNDNNKTALPEIAADLCCQGAQVLAWKHCSANDLCCRKSDVKVKLLNGSGGEKPATVVTGTVTTNGRCEQGVDVIVPSTTLCSFDGAGCRGVHPSAGDVLTMLLLALPRQTWAPIASETLRDEIAGLLSPDGLPTLLQEEVVYLGRQIYFLAADLGALS